MQRIAYFVKYFLMFRIEQAGFQKTMEKRNTLNFINLSINYYSAILCMFEYEYCQVNSEELFPKQLV